MSDYYSEQSRAASSGRAGADRMAAGLGICVDGDRGDLDEVLRLRAEIARLTAEVKRHRMTAEERHAAGAMIAFVSIHTIFVANDIVESDASKTVCGYLDRTKQKEVGNE